MAIYQLYSFLLYSVETGEIMNFVSTMKFGMARCIELVSIGDCTYWTVEVIKL